MDAITPAAALLVFLTQPRFPRLARRVQPERTGKVFGLLLQPAMLEPHLVTQKIK
jgi:hypothetical protein